MTDTPFSSFIGKLEAEGYSPRRGGNAQWSSLCPGHDDHRASLSIAEGDDGRVLVTCHATCATEDVVKALGTTMRDLYPDRANPRISLPRPNFAETQDPDARDPSRQNLRLRSRMRC